MRATRRSTRSRAGCCTSTTRTGYVGTYFSNLTHPASATTARHFAPPPSILTYTLQNVLFAVCALNELFFIALYLLSFSSPLLSPALLTPTTGDIASAQPGSPALPITKSIFPNPWSAAAMELARANKIDSTGPWILAGISAPVCLFKQVLNVIQLVNASKALAEVDLANRRRERLAAKDKQR
jgi:hypothetical protein